MICCLLFQDLLVAMKALGLNPTETEIQDLINEVERNGFIYYPAFCRVIMRKLREDDEENFRRELFRTMVGPKKYDGVPAPIYNYSREFLTFEQVLTSTLLDHSVQTQKAAYLPTANQPKFTTQIFLRERVCSRLELVSLGNFYCTSHPDSSRFSKVIL